MSTSNQTEILSQSVSLCSYLYQCILRKSDFQVQLGENNNPCQKVSKNMFIPKKKKKSIHLHTRKKNLYPKLDTSVMELTLLEWYLCCTVS